MKTIVINNLDTVGVALDDLCAGEQAGRTTLIDNIPRGHKFALADIRAGDSIIKYGSPIGTATSGIRAGGHVHTHNITTALQERVDYKYEPKPACAIGETNVAGSINRTIDAGKAGSPAVVGDAVGAGKAGSPVVVGGAVGVGDTVGAGSPVVVGGAVAEAALPGSFMGYSSWDGAVGTRNEIWIIPTVGCVNKTAEKLAEIGRRGYPETYAFTHPYGCSQLGGDQSRTQTLLANLVAHPNAGGVLIVGLGCENNYIDEFKRVLAGRYAGIEGTFGGRVRFLCAQECSDEFAEGTAHLEALAAYASRRSRSPAPLSKLRIGLKCGGSDGLSGVTANPLVGAVSDRVVRGGGAAVLTEVPEMFGAEHLLMNRCENEYLFGQTVGLINDFKQYYISHGQKIYENPSPGNKAGGISTLEDKSLGCTQKGGESPVRAVLRYGETVTANGLNLLESPGNDLVAITALTCAGAQLILFTTGRGTPVGAPVPTLKIASNSQLAEKKPAWIDFDAGRLVSGEGFGSLAGELYALVVETASGQSVAQNERHGYREIALFKDGVIL